MNQISGKVLSVGQPMALPGKDPQRPFFKREIIIDCTRHDPVTGHRSPYENTPALEFAGDKVGELDNVQPGDIVTISFDVEGRRYTDKEGMARIFTRIRPYRLEKQQQVYQTPQQPQPQQAPQQPQTLYGGMFPPQPQTDEPPF